jgi:hypothetical protein
MEFNYRYHGASRVEGNAGATALSFVPDTLREPTYFSARLAQRLAFREAISALNQVVVSDLRIPPKDRTEYFAWLQQQESAMLAEFMSRHERLDDRLRDLRHEIRELDLSSSQILKPFYRAQRKYFNYLYQHDYDAWFVLDPVITVHPDEVFFECFSQDESSYGRLACGFEVFEDVREFACGTTNIDYSAALYDEFQKIRDYKTTAFSIDPSGFEVATQGEDGYREVKIDLPESWLRGFLQVSSAMTLTLPLRRVELQPMDIHNICLWLRRRKEQHGPRSLRFLLTPDRPVRIVFEPWNDELICPRSIYRGDEHDEIRIWGRRRLLILERLIPLARGFTLYLLGSGLPSFYLADLGAMTFTLGLSGWTANDWARLDAFDLLAPRGEVDDFTRSRVFGALRETWQESADSLARRLNLERKLVHAALSAYVRAGRVIYDLNRHVYRLRELSREPLTAEQLRYAGTREQAAHRFIDADLVTLEMQPRGHEVTLSGTVRDAGQSYQPLLVLDADERLIKGECDCGFHIRNRLRRGPCEHLLALRLLHARRRARPLH